MAGGAFYGGGMLDDGAVILDHGGATWQLLLFALVAVTAGLWMLNGLGKYFGLDKNNPKQVDRTAAIGAGIALLAIVVLKVLVSMFF